MALDVEERRGRKLRSYFLFNARRHEIFHGVAHFVAAHSTSMEY